MEPAETCEPRTVPLTGARSRAVANYFAAGGLWKAIGDELGTPVAREPMRATVVYHGGRPLCS
jgi:hypothetical protein